MRSPELATIDRQGLREAFGAQQQQASERVAQSSGTVFFNVEIMLQGPEYPKSRLRENVEKFAAEHFFKATNRLAYFDGEEWRHPDGESYSDFFDRAIEYYRDSPNLVERFQAEKEGYIRAGILINNQRNLGNSIPKIGIASPPGDVYRNQSFVARNVTFIAMPICERVIKLGDLDERTYQEYQMIVIPSAEISTSEHWQTLIDSGDLQSTLVALNMLEGMVDANDSSWVVSLPVLLGNVENLVNKLGYASINDLIRETEKMFDLENDLSAPGRRKDMIDYFTDEMWRYISIRSQLSEQDQLKLKGLADVMHDYLSLEGGAQYRGQTFDEVKLLIEGHTKVHQRNLGVNFSIADGYTDWDYGESAYRMYFNQLQNNLRAQESRSNGGCPVNVNQSLFGSSFGVDRFSFGYEQPTYYGFDTINGYSTNTTTSIFESTSSGDSKPEGVVKETPHVGCPLCKDCDVTAYYTSTHIHCSKCKKSIALSNA